MMTNETLVAVYVLGIIAGAMFLLTTLAVIIANVVIHFYIRNNIKKMRELQEERESKWIGGAR